jgi:lipopolysaccharide/colanic/teichoic acid biosynthesis glycosyltransferase
MHVLRVFHHYCSARKLILFLIEGTAIALACILGAACCAAALMPAAARPELARALPALMLLGVAFVPTFQFALYLLDLYDLRVAAEDRGRGARLLKAAGVTTAFVGLMMLAIPAMLPVHLPPGALLGGALGALVGTLAVRASLHAVVGGPSRVLLVGDGLKARAVATAIEQGGEGAYKVVSIVDPRRHAAQEPRGEAVDVLAERLGADFVVQASDDVRGSSCMDALLRCRLAGRRVYDAAGFCERVLRRFPVQHLRASDFAFADELTVTPLRRLAKRLFDIAVASTLLLCAAPFLVLVVAAIKLDSKGPLFYRRSAWAWAARATGCGSSAACARTRRRTARCGPGPMTTASPGWGRFIRKTRIDEIPQVLNVLLGDMSFVGPRPERPVFVEQLKQQIPFYGLREAVKPGLTGWAQIRYPYGASGGGRAQQAGVRPVLREERLAVPGLRHHLPHRAACAAGAGCEVAGRAGGLEWWTPPGGPGGEAVGDGRGRG